MLYLCEVTHNSDPKGLDRLKGYVLSEPGLGETEWMFCATKATTLPEVGDLVWASLVHAERNVFAWVYAVPPEDAESTRDIYDDVFDTYT